MIVRVELPARSAAVRSIDMCAPRPAFRALRRSFSASDPSRSLTVSVPVFAFFWVNGFVGACAVRDPRRVARSAVALSEQASLQRTFTDTLVVLEVTLRVRDFVTTL